MNFDIQKYNGEKVILLTELCQDAKIDRTSILRSKHVKPYKIGNRWYVDLKGARKFVDNYRYGKFGTRTGRWWTQEEIRTLTKNRERPIKEIAKMLSRSYGAVKVMRCKIGITG